MLKTKLTKEEIPSYDIEIAEFIRTESFKEKNGHKMVIGIENQNKQIYRVVETTGFGDFMEMLSFLFDLGMTDILEQKLSSVGGYDARFRHQN